MLVQFLMFGDAVQVVLWAVCLVGSLVSMVWSVALAPRSKGREVMFCFFSVFVIIGMYIWAL